MSEPNREKVLHWLECLIGYSHEYDSNMAEQTIALIKELTEEKSALEYKLLGVMHSVDKWLEGDELEQDEVNRAATMREKTLRIVEELTAKVKALEDELSWVGARPIMYVSKKCPNCGRIRVEHYTNGKHVCEKCHWCIEENQYRESIFDYT